MTERELNIVRDLNAQIRELETHLVTLRRCIENLSPKLDGLPRSTTIQSQVEKIALEIVESSRELEALREQILFATAKLTNEICRAVVAPQERTVLILRYVACMNFRDISFQLNFSDRKVYALHHDGLKNLQMTCS